jgi:hypothetical protein
LPHRLQKLTRAEHSREIINAVNSDQILRPTRLLHQRRLNRVLALAAALLLLGHV